MGSVVWKLRKSVFREHPKLLYGDKEIIRNWKVKTQEGSFVGLQHPPCSLYIYVPHLEWLMSFNSSLPTIFLKYWPHFLTFSEMTFQWDASSEIIILDGQSNMWKSQLHKFLMRVNIKSMLSERVYVSVGYTVILTSKTSPIQLIWSYLTCKL